MPVKRFRDISNLTAKILLAKDLREKDRASFRFDCGRRMRKAYQRLGFVKTELKFKRR